MNGIAIPILAAALLSVIGGAYLRHRERALAKERNNDINADYFDSLTRDDLSRRIAMALRGRLQGVMATPNFPVRPTDSVWKVFGLADDDLDDIVLQIVHAEGCVLPSRDLIQRQPPIETVGDVMRYVYWACSLPKAS